MGNYRIIACDLDETLLGSDRQVSQKNAAAIRKARERGVKFVPATGRGYASVQNVLQALGLEGAAGEYVLSYNGGAGGLLFLRPLSGVQPRRRQQGQRPPPPGGAAGRGSGGDHRHRGQLQRPAHDPRGGPGGGRGQRGGGRPAVLRLRHQGHPRPGRRGGGH